MTLKEAINHCQEVIDNCNNEECSLDHKQLLLWLKELRCLRKVVDPKYLKGIDYLQDVYGTNFEHQFEIELRRDLTGMFATPKSLGELHEIFGGYRNRNNNFYYHPGDGEDAE